jgi:hypothetical protein
MANPAGESIGEVLRSVRSLGYRDSPATSVTPFQATIPESQMIHKIQYLSGRTLKA